MEREQKEINSNATIISKFNKITINDQLGEGSFGSVWKLTEKENADKK